MKHFICHFVQWQSIHDSNYITVKLAMYRTVKNFGGEKTLANHNNSPTFLPIFILVHVQYRAEMKIEFGWLGLSIDS